MLLLHGERWFVWRKQIVPSWLRSSETSQLPAGISMPFSAGRGQLKENIPANTVIEKCVGLGEENKKLY